jgi:hypothetical protein
MGTTNGEIIEKGKKVLNKTIFQKFPPTAREKS